MKIFAMATFAGCLLTCASDIAWGQTQTNVPPKWVPLAELRKQWESQPVEALVRAAESGEVTAQHYLGYSYASGTRVPRDAANAVKWYERAAGGGYLASLQNLGALYRFGGLVPRDPQKAGSYFRRAAEKGFPAAMIQLGLLYRYGEGVERDSEAAIQWFQKAFASGDPNGAASLGSIYQDDLGRPNEAFKYYQQAADGGASDGMYGLYLLYVQGSGVKQDVPEGERWLLKAAETGNARAACDFAYYNEYPHIGSGASVAGKPASAAAAFKWYRRAAELGSFPGEYHLALCYLHGYGVEMDEERALELMRVAADHGWGEAMHELVKLYAEGIGEPRNREDEPLAWLKKIVARSYQEREWIKGKAYDEIIFRHEHGVGTPRDLLAAAEWYCQATLSVGDRYSFEDLFKPPDSISRHTSSSMTAAYWHRGIIMVAGVGASQSSEQLAAVLRKFAGAADPKDTEIPAVFAQMYLDGRDTPKNPAKAWAWFNLAAERHSTEAAAKRDELGKALTPAELADARRQAGELNAFLNQVRQALPQRTGR